MAKQNYGMELSEFSLKLPYLQILSDYSEADTAQLSALKLF